MSKYETLVKILDELRKEAPDNYKRYHPAEDDKPGLDHARSRAYIHLYLKGIYGIDNFYDREKFITDDAQDGGIDAYFIDREARNIVFIQSKFRTTEENFENKEIEFTELLSMDIANIIEGEKVDDEDKQYNSKILNMQKEIQKIEDIGRYDYKIIILANVKEKNGKFLRKLTGGFNSEVFNFEKSYEKLVFPVVSGCFFNAEEIIINLSLENKEGGEGRIRYTVNTELNDCNILVTFVPLIEIAKILYKYKNSILKYNPRCFLGLKNNQVNPQIANTVTSKHTNEFALFNNGITILSDETSINSYIAKKDSAQLVITNPQIINGGQTAFTLASLYEECKTSDDLNVFNEKEVLVKIITFLKDNKENQTDDEIKQKKIKLIENLSKATNEQSAVKEINRRSNESVLVSFQNSIYREFSLFLNRKEGEFYEGLTKNYISRKQIIELSNFIRISASIKGDVKIARQSSENVLFKEHNFKKYINHEEGYKKIVFGYLCYQYLTNIEKQLENFGMERFGHALRYGKYAVVNVVCRKFNDDWEKTEYQNNAQSITDQVLNKWKDFENYIIQQIDNSYYFYEYKDESNNIRTIYNFDGYYKGYTIDNNLKDFDFFL